MRFSLRGYDQRYESTYINGVQFNGLERGNFNYSSLGGLNDAFRNQEEVYGTMANSFSYGDLAGVSNINARASTYAAQTKGSLAFSNRSYKLRAQITHGTGILSNGWAFAGSAVVRWADNAIAYSDRWLESGSYLRLKNVQIGYTFPKKWMKSTHFLENSRLYLGAQNLFTITKYSGYDPEISGGSVYAKGNDDGHYPPVRMFTMGLQLSF
jgi:hypothetical protein